MPNPRPPFPAVKGLFGKPTNINNVETLANIPVIMTKGSDWFASVGTEKSKGTKVFALAGKISYSGLVEVPMGTPLREIIDDIGGGIPNKRKFKAAQTGGPSGGCIPAAHFDVPMDYENLTQLGAIMGSGGLIVTDEHTCMVDMAKFFLTFTQKESCGKCVPCRLGTKKMLEILEAVTKGKATVEDLDQLVELAEDVKISSLCGLGQTAPNPALSTVRYFRDEYEAHILRKECPARVCVNLIKFEVNEQKCKKCGACFTACPTKAITWKKKEVARIDRDKCIACRSCYPGLPISLHRLASVPERGHMDDKLTLTINGISVRGKKGQTVLEVCRENGIHVPTLCYHPKMPPYGGCRLCIVEIENMRGLPPSCTTPATDAMKVTTHTERLLRVRKTVLELLLAYGDHNCLMCEKNGECELQNLVYEHGIDTVRFKTGFVPRPVDASSSMIVRDPNKCVLCGRCVRACLCVQVNGVIDMAGRGADACISTFNGMPLQDSNCVYCGECVAACPTGALTGKQARFKGRPVGIQKNGDDLRLLRRRLPARTQR